MSIEACRAAIARFGRFCEREPLVVAAFLGDSFASGRSIRFVVHDVADAYVAGRPDLRFPGL